MPRSDRFLYSSFLRLFRRYQAEGVPLTGIAGTSIVVPDGRPAVDSLRHLFREPSNLDIAGGLKLLSMLQTQLDVLVSSEEETRQALAEWEQLLVEQQAGRGTHGWPPAAASVALAAEQGMQLMVQQAQQLDELFSSSLDIELQQQEEEEEEEEGGGGEGELSPHEPVSLDSLAAEVQQLGAELAASSPGGGIAGEPPQLLEASALSEVLYRRHRYRFRPFEWVYDGLKPLMLPEVLKRRRGAPLALAVLAAAVGRRAGLALMPLPVGELMSGVQVPSSSSSSSSSWSELLEQIPPHLAAKVSLSATQGGAPPAQQPWLLRIEQGVAQEAGTGATAEQQQQQQQLEHQFVYYMDAATGEILDSEAALGKYPGLGQVGDAAQHAALTVWQDLVRTIIQAHQRRGESDQVAHWTYVLLALDPAAQEWQYMLQPGG